MRLRLALLFVAALALGALAQLDKEFCRAPANLVFLTPAWEIPGSEHPGIDNMENFFHLVLQKTADEIHSVLNSGYELEDHVFWGTYGPADRGKQASVFERRSVAQILRADPPRIDYVDVAECETNLPIDAIWEALTDGGYRSVYYNEDSGYDRPMLGDWKIEMHDNDWTTFNRAKRRDTIFFVFFDPDSGPPSPADQFAPGRWQDTNTAPFGPGDMAAMMDDLLRGDQSYNHYADSTYLPDPDLSDADPRLRPHLDYPQMYKVVLWNFDAAISSDTANIQTYLDEMPTPMTRFMTAPEDFCPIGIWDGLDVAEDQEGAAELLADWMGLFVTNSATRGWYCEGAARPGESELERVGREFVSDPFDFQFTWFWVSVTGFFAVLLWCCFCQPFHLSSEDEEIEKEKEKEKDPAGFAALAAGATPDTNDENDDKKKKKRRTCRDYCYIGCFASIRLFYFKLLLVFEAWVQRGFRGLGRFVARRPRPVFWFMVLLGLTSVAMVIVKINGPREEWLNTNVQELWSRPTSRILGTFNFFVDSFEPGSVLPAFKASMIVRKKESVSAPSFSLDILEALLELEQDIEGHEQYANNTLSDGTEIPSCYFLKAPNLCVRNSVLDYWRDYGALNESLVNGLFPEPTMEPFETDFWDIYERTTDPERLTAYGLPIWRGDVMDIPVAAYGCYDKNTYTTCDYLEWHKCGCKGYGCGCGETDDGEKCGDWVYEDAVYGVAFDSPEHVCTPPRGEFWDFWDDEELRELAKQWDQEFSTGLAGGYHTAGREYYLSWGAKGPDPEHFRFTWYRLPTAATKASDWTDFFLNYQLPDSSPLEIVARYHDEELFESVNDAAKVPIPMVGAVLGGIVGFILFTFFRKENVESRMTLGLIGFSGTLLGLMTGFALVLVGLGEAMSTTVVIVPVVIMSIGVDDMFLLTDAFDEMVGADGIENRVVEAVQGAGLAMMMTTVTDALAFLLGVFSDTEAVRVMSLFAFWCILTDFMFQVTMFPAAMTLDAQRQQGNHGDVGLLSFLIRDSAEYKASLRKGEGEEGEEGEEEKHDEEHHGSYFLGELMGPLLVQRCCAVIVLILFAGLTTLAAMVMYADLQTGMGLDTIVDARVGSAEYLSVERELFRNPPSSPSDLLHVAGPSGDTNVAAGFGPESIHFPQGLEYGLEWNNWNFEVGHKIVSWYDAFNAWAADRENDVYPDNFNTMLGDWIEEISDATTVRQDLIVDDNGDYVASKAWAQALLPHSVGRPENWVGYYKDIEDSIFGSIEPRLSSMNWFSGDLALLEPSLDLMGRLSLDVVYTALIVAVVAVFFLQHPSASLLMVFAFISVVVQCLGGMAYLNMPLNAFSQVSLIIALGLSIDYIAHITHGFVSAAGNRQEKAVHSLAVHGPAVFNGMATTAIGMTMLGLLGHIQLVRGFAWMILLVQIVGLMHAFVLIPSMLSLLGPRTHRNPVVAVLVENRKAQIRASNIMAINLVDLRGGDIFAVSGAQAGAADAQAVKAADMFSNRRSQMHPDLYGGGGGGGGGGWRQTMRSMQPPNQKRLKRVTMAAVQQDYSTWMEGGEQAAPTGDYRYTVALQRLERRKKKKKRQQDGGQGKSYGDAWAQGTYQTVGVEDLTPLAPPEDSSRLLKKKKSGRDEGSVRGGSRKGSKSGPSRKRSPNGGLNAERRRSSGNGGRRKPSRKASGGSKKSHGSNRSRGSRGPARGRTASGGRSRSRDRRL